MALRRLARDLRSLEDAPLPGIAAAPLPDDLQTWHFNLRGPGGELGGLVVHGVLRVPPTYPSRPPQVRLCTPLPHPNVWAARDGGFHVCSDMLDAGSSAPYSGWSSSYCIGSLLLQLQSSLFDPRAAVYDEVPAAAALRLAGAYACACGHRPGCAKPALPTSADLDRVASKKVVARPCVARLLGESSARPKPQTRPAAAQAAGEGAAAAGAGAAAAAGPTTAREEEEDGWREVERRGSRRTPAASAKEAAKDFLVRVLRNPSKLSTTQKRNARRAKRRSSQRSQLAQEAGDEQASTAASTALLDDSGATVVFVLPKLPPERDEEAAGSRMQDDSRSETTGLLNKNLMVMEPAAEAELATSTIEEAEATAGEAQGPPARAEGIRRLPHRLLIEVLSMVAPEDAARAALCGRFFASLGEDGILWRHLFSQTYPSSALTAESMHDWKHCFLLEVNHLEADLVCFHTKLSFREAVLGVPLDFSMNPRTQRVDYISTTLDLLSAEAFDGGLRLSRWNEPVKEWLPLFLTPEHFQRGRARFERTVVRLSPHWGSSRFHPHMALEVVPKLMNTMIVLLCDKGLEASDRALDGYFLLWRLLRAVVEAYGLEKEVQSRISAFKEPRNRTKRVVPSIGEFLPLLSACGAPQRAWQCLAQAVFEETFDRNVLWACRDHPEYAAPKMNVLGEGADLPRLQATLESTRVSKRLLMFHVKFLELVAGQSADLFFGFPPQHTRKAFKGAVRGILAVERWPEFFAACGRGCPSPARLTDILRQATKNSLRKGYHTSRTDFRKIQASGVSHILKKGESYKVESSVGRMLLHLGSDSESILCGACLLYEDLSCAAVVSYDRTSAYRHAVKHSGDTIVDGKSRHVIEVDLKKLPASVTRLFFTLCACGCQDLSGFRTPSIDMRDPDSDQPLCTYNLEQVGRAPTVVMCAVLREPSGWRVKALGVPSSVACCGSYTQVKRDIAALRL